MSGIFIIGSGPAGISAAIYAKRAGVPATVISQGIGALAKAEKIQNYYGFADAVSGRDLYMAGINGARNVGVDFITDEVVWLGFDDKMTGLRLKTVNGEYYADSVILAAGAARKAPPIEGLTAFEGQGVSYCAICDAFFYRGREVAVLGAGDYAVHELEALRPHVAKLTLFTDGTEPADNVPENVDIITAKIVAIEGDERVRAVRLADGRSIAVEGVFVAYGTAGGVELAREIGAAVEGARVFIDSNMATNVPGLYAAGDCTGGLMQIAKAVYEGAKAGLAAAGYVRHR